MKTINLRDVFPTYTLDCYIEVPDNEYEAFLNGLTQEIADVYISFEREEVAYLRMLFRYKAHYSLDCDDGIEGNVLFPVLSPEDEYEAGIKRQNLYASITRLPEKQANRIYAHYILGLSKTEIARIEGVHKMSVSNSITHGLRNLEKLLKSFF